MKKKLSILFFILISPLVMGQELDYQEIDTNNVSNWIEKYPRAYAGVYMFGDSESESNLVIIYAKNTLVAQISQFEWNEEANQFFTHYETLTNVKIGNGRFESDQYKGRFINYLDGEIKHIGLRIDNPWTVGMENGTWELGLKSKFPFTCNGEYPEATTKFLYQSDLEKMSLTELKYMRNEIFARYGYIFRPGGKMDVHFKATDWYRPQHKNVDAFLTTIEKKNIELIQRFEKQLH
jgi:hypothetical protein